MLGNHKALELAVAYYGSDHVLFGTDAPLGIAPVGPTKEITAALQQANLTSKEREQIMYLNFEKLMAGLPYAVPSASSPHKVNRFALDKMIFLL